VTAVADIPPFVLLGAVELGESAGLDVRPWFAGTGTDPAALAGAGAARVTLGQAATVLRRAVRAMPGRPVGMRIGGRDPLLTMGMLGVAMRSSATLGDAVATGIELHRAAGSLLDFELDRLGAESALCLYERRPDPELIALCCEEAFCSCLLFVRTILGTGWSPARLELTYPPPGYVADYHRFFRCELRFGAEANRLVFATAELARPLPTHNESTRTFALDACRRLLAGVGDRPGVVGTVETLLGRNLRRPPSPAGQRGQEGAPARVQDGVVVAAAQHQERPVQAGLGDRAADRLVDADPAGAREVLRNIRAQGRETLTALRELVGILRDEDGGGRAPQPGLARTGDLFAVARAAGMVLTTTVEGAPGPLSRQADLAAFRIVQEALTNCRRHAPGAPVTVRIVHNDGVLLEIRNGRAAAGPAGSGHGLAGMRERVRQAGGTLRAGPDGDGGWVVVAELPAAAG